MGNVGHHSEWIVLGIFDCCLSVDRCVVQTPVFATLHMDMLCLYWVFAFRGFHLVQLLLLLECFGFLTFPILEETTSTSTVLEEGTCLHTDCIPCAFSSLP